MARCKEQESEVAVGGLFSRYAEAMCRLDDSQKEALRIWASMVELHERASRFIGVGESDAFCDRFEGWLGMFEEAIRSIGAGDALELLAEKTL